MESSRILYLIILTLNIESNFAKSNSNLTNVEAKLEDKFSGYINYATKILEDYNDKNLGASEIGKFLGYNSLKPILKENGNEERGLKKLSMALIPLIFHIGATSTWMLITSLMTVKSVGVGLMLLVFKIAVSSAKVASFFTTLKSKSVHRPEWSWTHSPHIHDYGHERRLPTGTHSAHEYTAYIPDTHVETSPYKVITSYKQSEHESPVYTPEYGEHPKRRNWRRR